MAKGDPCKHCGKPVTINRGLQCNRCRNAAAKISIARCRSSAKYKARAKRRNASHGMKAAKAKYDAGDKGRDRLHARRFGISLEEYREMKAAQLGDKVGNDD